MIAWLTVKGTFQLPFARYLRSDPELEVFAAMLTNSFINAVVFRVLGLTWRRSLYAGALLAQVGEFSFMLAAVGLHSGMINAFGYQITIGVIALTLLVSPVWFSLAKRLFVQA